MLPRKIYFSCPGLLHLLTRRGMCSLPVCLHHPVSQLPQLKCSSCPLQMNWKSKKKILTSLYLGTPHFEWMWKIIFNKTKPWSYLTLNPLVLLPLSMENMFISWQSPCISLVSGCFNILPAIPFKSAAMVLSDCFWEYKLMQHKWRGIWQYRSNQMWMHISFDQATCFQKIYFYTHIFAKGPKNKVIHWSVVHNSERLETIYS